jgi:ADP-ribosylglycohydrolase
VWCLAIRHAVLNGELDIRVGLPYLSDEASVFWTERLDEAGTVQPAHFRPNGYVVTALQAACAAVVQTPVPYESIPGRHLVDALGAAIRIGDDTDTVAAIAGALLGGRWGTSAVPLEWRRMLHGYPGICATDLEELARRIVRADPSSSPGKAPGPAGQDGK